MYIYKSNIPSFEKYELFDLHEEDWKATTFLLGNNKGIRHINTLYIKGIDKWDKPLKKISCDEFKKDYLKLGKKLFELATKYNKISFTLSDVLDDADLISNYSEKILLDISLPNEYMDTIKKILSIKEELEDAALDNIFCDIIWGCIDLSDEILNLLLILDEKTSYTIDNELSLLLEINDTTLEKYKSSNACGNADKILTIFLEAQFKLNELLEKIDCIQKNEDFDLRKELSISNNSKNFDKTTKTNIYNKFQDSLLEVVFTYGQIKDLKRIIINWLDIYGFPYYIKDKDMKKYEKVIKKVIELKENEQIVPCETLITNSIFNYMLYEIFSNWKTADSKIKCIFGFNDKDIKVNSNKATIEGIRKAYSYYNESVCSKIFGFNTKEVEDGYEDDSKFKNNESGKTLNFYNLCLVANRLIKEELLKPIDTKKDFCPICGKKFIKNGKHRTYCSKRCSEKGATKNNTENKREKRANKN